jgi:hypothetical protein
MEDVGLDLGTGEGSFPSQVSDQVNGLRRSSNEA